MMIDIAGLGLAQKDGGLPTLVTAGRARAKAASPSSARASRALCIQCEQRQHLVWFQRHRLGCVFTAV